MSEGNTIIIRHISSVIGMISMSITLFYKTDFVSSWDDFNVLKVTLLL